MAISSRATEPSVAGRIAQALRARLKAGAYAPGQRLIESELCEAFSVSRGPVREALRQLVADGLLTQEHNRGARVPRLTRAEIGELYRVREVIEGLAARMAAEHIDRSGNREKLRRLAAEMEATVASGDMAPYDVLNERLHALIVALADSPLLTRLFDQLTISAMRLQFRPLLVPEQPRRSHEEHRPIIAAIDAGRPDAAEQAMREHIRATRGSLDALADDVFG